MVNLIKITTFANSTLILVLAIIISFHNNPVTDVIALSISNSSTSSSSESIPTPTWTEGENMTTPRTDFAYAGLNGKIYIIGGFDDKGNTTATVESYDPEENRWATVTPLPEPLDHSGAATDKNKIYVIGGYRSDRSPSEKLFIYK